MNRQYEPIVNAIRECVQSVQDALLPYLQTIDPNISVIRYEHGHFLELIETLKQVDSNPNLTVPTKYPLVYLVQDFPVKRRTTGYYGEATLRIIVMNSTDRTYKASQRYENNFIPILHPIKDELFDAIDQHRAFVSPSGNGNFECTETDRLYWGKTEVSGNSANKLSDYIDAIEIQDLKLTLAFNQC